MKALALLALLLAPPRVAMAEVWVIARYFPNATHAASGWERPATRVLLGTGPYTTRYYLFTWSHTSETGLFYQSVDEPMTGRLCTGGVPEGTHGNYGRAGAGYDWYAVTEAGHHYLGWMFFHQAGGGRAECDYDVGVVIDPYAVAAFPRTVDDTRPLPAPRLVTIQSTTTLFTEDGTVLRHGVPRTATHRLSIVQPGGVGTMLGLKIDDPAGSGWYNLDWLSGPTHCGLPRCWPYTFRPAEQYGIWRWETHASREVGDVITEVLPTPDPCLCSPTGLGVHAP